MTDFKMTDPQLSDSSRAGYFSAAADNDPRAANVWSSFRAVTRTGGAPEALNAFANAVSADLAAAKDCSDSAAPEKSGSDDVFRTLASEFRPAGTADSASLAAGLKTDVKTPPLMEKLPEKALGGHPVSNEEAFNTLDCA